MIRAAVFALLLAAAAPAALSQQGAGNVVYVPTPQIVVDAMLRMAKVGAQDFVIDLGSGDGRMVITAAKTFGARGYGVELDKYLLELSNNNARNEGVAERAQFRDENLFETDLAPATVITTYLLPEMNLKLRPKILDLKPGTRVVAHDYHFGDWLPDERQTLAVPEKKVGTPGVSHVYLWLVPARVAGSWRVEAELPDGTRTIDVRFEQRFQMLTGSAAVDGRPVRMQNAFLRGGEIGFSIDVPSGRGALRRDFRGRVQEGAMSGVVAPRDGEARSERAWRATLVRAGTAVMN